MGNCSLSLPKRISRPRPLSPTAHRSLGNRGSARLNTPTTAER
jgi:hypothetical protein